MRFFAAFATVVLVGLLLASPAAAQTAAPPESLKVSVASQFLSADLKLKAAAPTAGPCAAMANAPPGPGTDTFVLANPTNSTGSYWLFSAMTIRLSFRGTTDQANQASTPGFTSKVEVKIGATSVGSQTFNHGPSASGVQAQEYTVSAPTGNVSSGTGDLSVIVTLTPNPPQQGLPLPQNVAVACGESSTVGAFTLVRGNPGEDDLDRDGIPDPTDTDKDGDGASDQDEARKQCVYNNAPINFAQEAPVNGGNANDHDNDGFTDERECAAGSNPLDEIDVPPPPKPFPWALLIFGLLLIILIVAVIFFFTTFGKAVAVSVVSANELIVPPGQKGKFEVLVRSLRKKGNPINFQLQARGMPEGWDAKLSHDHVVLDPQGGSKSQETVFLTVEAATHSDAESAVIAVKAIPLNAAGRKDTFKLPASAKTITSINVPPNAKVPVKRGAPVKTKSEKDLAKEAAAPPAEEPLAAQAPPTVEQDAPVISIEGIGETYAKKLEKMGITTIHQLRAADTEAVAKKTGAEPATVEQWKAMAELIDLPGVGPQYAELLVRAGVASILQLADSDAKKLAADVERVQEGRAVRIQGGPSGQKTVKNWIKAAQKHPASKAPAPVPAAAAPAAAPAPAAKPNLQVGGLAHAPASFRAGESVKSTVNVTNGGGAAQTIKLSLFVNDALADAQTVNVKPGKSKEVKFKWTAQERNKLNIRGELVAG